MSTNHQEELRPYVKDGFHGGEIAQAKAQGSKDCILPREEGEFLEIGFGCLRVPDIVAKHLSEESDVLGGLFQGWVDEDDLD